MLCIHCEYFETDGPFGGLPEDEYFVCHHPNYGKSVDKYEEQTGEDIPTGFIRGELGDLVFGDHLSRHPVPKELPWCPLIINE